MNLKDLLAETVSHCLYINLDRSIRRRDEFEEWAKDLPFLRVQGIDGAKLDKTYLTSRKESCLLGNSDIQKRGAIGCAMSHIRAIEEAMSLIKISGDQRPVLIMEDDARIPEINLPILQSVLESSAAGDHCLLGDCWHQITRGLFPIATEHPHIVEPTGAQSTAAYLVSPRMLPVLRDVYRFNLERPDMRLVDCVNAEMQRLLALKDSFPVYNEYEESLIQVFRASCEKNHVDAPKFRAVSPSIISLTNTVSTISPPSGTKAIVLAFDRAMARIGIRTSRVRAHLRTASQPVTLKNPAKTLPREGVAKLSTFVLDMYNLGKAAQVGKMLNQFANDQHNHMSVTDLIDTIRAAVAFPTNKHCLSKAADYKA